MRKAIRRAFAELYERARAGSLPLRTTYVGKCGGGGGSGAGGVRAVMSANTWFDEKARVAGSLDVWGRAQPGAGVPGKA